jgi:hypothetical protein
MEQLTFVDCDPGAMSADDLEAHIHCRLSGRIRNLHVFQRDRGLVLQGHALTYYAKQLAQHAVMEASDLPILANEIEVA